MASVSLSMMCSQRLRLPLLTVTGRQLQVCDWQIDGCQERRNKLSPAQHVVDCFARYTCKRISQSSGDESSLSSLFLLQAVMDIAASLCLLYTALAVAASRLCRLSTRLMRLTS